MPLITFSNSNRVIRSEGGETLLALLQRAGIAVETPCGGLGKCGKCSVLLGNGIRVSACTYVPEEDIEIAELPGSHSTGEKVLTDYKIDEPAVVDLGTIADASPHRSESPHMAAVDLETIADASPHRSVSLYMAAVDLGTTTLAAYLLAAEDGQEAATVSRLNPQTIYGADVITRAQYVLDHGTEEMTLSIRRAIMEMLSELCEEAGTQTEQIIAVSIAGNTCMHHFFLGLDVNTLVHAPYTPAMLEAAVWKADDLGFALHPDAKIYTFPNIAGFVGGDTVAGLTATRLAEMEEWTLLLDIGTNGEIVLGRQHKLYACSTAAGPAFEGAGISCGMRGSIGAISGAKWEGDHFALNVIGGGPALGICGSGLLDLCAELLLSGQMDEYGALCYPDRSRTSADDTNDTCEESDARQEVLLFQGNADKHLAPVALTQKDIRQLQLAKAAIASGIECLVEEAGINVDEIRQVLLAGAFGSFLNPDSSCAIGLIPPVLEGRIKAIGNASGAGAVCVLKNPADWEYAKAAASETLYIELAKQHNFQDLFVENMLFSEE